MTGIPVAGGELVGVDYLNAVGRPIFYSKLAAPAASFDITSINGTYANLVLKLQVRGTTAANSVNANVRFNNDSGANYDYMMEVGRAAGIAIAESLATTAIRASVPAASTAPAAAADAINIAIDNYSGTTFHKQAICLGTGKEAASAGNLFLYSTSGWWRNTAAITRITVLPAAGNWDTGSTCMLIAYGVV